MDKILVLVRGIPGSGKTTFAKKYAKQHEHGVVFEADQFFEMNGKYKFDPAFLKTAHSCCKNSVRENMEKIHPLIIVSNTFTRFFEMKDYFDLAKEFGYKVLVKEMPNDPVLNGSQKNIHGVPENIIQNMLTKWENLPNNLKYEML